MPMDLWHCYTHILNPYGYGSKLSYGFPTKHDQKSVGHWYHNFEPNPYINLGPHDLSAFPGCGEVVVAHGDVHRQSFPGVLAAKHGGRRFLTLNALAREGEWLILTKHFMVD